MNVGSSNPHADPPLPIMAAGGSLRRMIHVTHIQAATIINIRKREVLGGDRRPAEDAVSGSTAVSGPRANLDVSAFISLAKCNTAVGLRQKRPSDSASNSAPSPGFRPRVQGYQGFRDTRVCDCMCHRERKSFAAGSHVQARHITKSIMRRASPPNGPIVLIDNGGGSIKAGLAGDTAPR